MKRFATTALITLTATVAAASEESVSDDVIAGQRAALAEATEGKGFGPQAPRDLTQKDGDNRLVFGRAPDYTQMNLCNIHFHKGAEHRGGEFTEYAGNGDGEGNGTGFLYNGTLTEAELAPVDYAVGVGPHGALIPGDTIEVHYVHTTAVVDPGPSLGSCLSEATGNPQLRVETQVYVLVNDDAAADFVALATVERVDGYWQAPRVPANTGDPIQYAGSTTGPSYNMKGSPFQVSWSVRPEVLKVDIASLDAWLGNNMFDEKYAHGVRNLVTNRALLSPISN